MSNTINNDVVKSNQIAADTFMGLANIYLDGIERLAALNLNTAREAIGECGAATKTLYEAQSGGDYTKVLSVLGQPMWDKAVAHSRGTYEIVAKTNEALSSAIKEQWANGGPMGSGGLMGWNGLSELFTKGFQQAAAATKENVATASAAASKVVAASTEAARKVA